MNIDGKTKEEILKVVNECFDIISKIANDEGEDRKAGVFTINVFDVENILVENIADFKAVPGKSLAGWRVNSEEKALRLTDNIMSGHVSSEQSRNFKKKMYRGSIFTGKIILSFSGLSEFDDEALMLLVAYRLDWIDLKGIQEIAQISNNPRLPIIKELIQK